MTMRSCPSPPRCCSRRVIHAHVKKNDTVVVLSGKDKGKRGKVLGVGRSGTRSGGCVNVVHRQPSPPRASRKAASSRRRADRPEQRHARVPKCDKPTRISIKVDTEAGARGSASTATSSSPTDQIPVGRNPRNGGIPSGQADCGTERLRPRPGPKQEKSAKARWLRAAAVADLKLKARFHSEIAPALRQVQIFQPM